MRIKEAMFENISYLETVSPRLKSEEVKALDKVKKSRILSLNQMLSLSQIRRRYDKAYDLMKTLDSLDERANEILRKEYCRRNRIEECMVLDLSRVDVLYKAVENDN